MVATVFVGLPLSASDVVRQDVVLQDSNIEVFNLDNTKKVVLTFDDGPGKGTDQILTILKKYGIRATFFALGQQIKKILR